LIAVSLSELVNRGYISSNNVHAFDGLETRVWLAANPGMPQSVLISARLPDGSVSAVLADGSVQQFSAENFSQQLKKAGQNDDAANRSQQVPSATNSTSSPAVSGR
jgi:hypothetical protein